MFSKLDFKGDIPTAIYLITYAYTSTVSEPNIIEIPKIFENAEIIRISDNAITPGSA